MVKRRITNKRVPTRFSTVNNIQNSLRGGSQAHDFRFSSPYLHCRLNPFGNSEVVGLPDTANNRRLVVDHRGALTFSSTADNFVMILMPSSRPCLFGMNGDVTINGTTYTAGSGLMSAPNDFLGGYSNTNVPYAYTGNTQGPYSAQSVRLLGAAWKLTYMGRSADASGVVTTNYVPNTKQLEVISPNAITTITNTGATGATVAAGVAQNVIVMDISSGTSQVGPDTVTSRIETNPWGILKRCRQTNDYTKWLDSPAVLVKPVTNASNQLETYTRNLDSGAASVAASPFISWYDDDWCCTSITCQGMASQVMRLDVQYCVEYDVHVTSGLIALTKAPPAKDDFALSVAAEVEKLSPSSMPSKSTQPSIPKDIINKAVDVVGKKAMAAAKDFATAAGAGPIPPPIPKDRPGVVIQVPKPARLVTPKPKGSKGR